MPDASNGAPPDRWRRWFRISVLVLLAWIAVKLGDIHETAEAAQINAGRAIGQASSATAAAQEATSAAEEARDAAQSASDMCDR